MRSNCSIDAPISSSGARKGGPAPEGGGFPSGSPLSYAHNRPFVEYYEGASLIKSSKGVCGVAMGGGKRGQVKGFSASSRRRLLYTIGAIRRDAELPNFVTLTYPDKFPTVEVAKRDLKVFRQRFDRQYPNAGAIWKLEPQQRGAPHYHLLVWGCNTAQLLAWTVKNWYDIAGNGDLNHLYFHSGMLKGSQPCVSKVRSFRGVWAYAAKYLGKTFDVAEWGQKWTGRFWGVIRRENIPFGALVQVELPYKRVVTLMRYQRRFSRVKVRQYNSLSTFCDADQWVKNLIHHNKLE